MNTKSNEKSSATAGKKAESANKVSNRHWLERIVRPHGRISQVVIFSVIKIITTVVT